MVLHLPKGKRKIAVVAGVIGNIMEWYDFALYGFMAQIISQLFFPEGNQTANLLATYGIFAAGFIMRPIGSIVFGWMGDTIGRSKTMLISVSLMTIPTFCSGTPSLICCHWHLGAGWPYHHPITSGIIRGRRVLKFRHLSG